MARSAAGRGQAGYLQFGRGDRKDFAIARLADLVSGPVDGGSHGAVLVDSRPWLERRDTQPECGKPCQFRPATLAAIVSREWVMSRPYSYEEAFKAWTVGRKSTMSVERSLYEQIQRLVRPDHRTLEFGCGLSTFAFAMSGSHTVVEDDPEFCGIFKKTMHSRLVHGWYEKTPGGKFDIVLVDGPSEERGAVRELGLECILSACKPTSIVFIDDVHRDGELRLARRLCAVLGASICFKDRWSVIVQSDAKLC